MYIAILISSVFLLCFLWKYVIGACFIGFPRPSSFSFIATFTFSSGFHDVLMWSFLASPHYYFLPLLVHPLRFFYSIVFNIALLSSGSHDFAVALMFDKLNKFSSPENLFVLMKHNIVFWLEKKYCCKNRTWRVLFYKLHYNLIKTHRMLSIDCLINHLSLQSVR